jgi:C_GCAxxG_C_C family probable redox protein
MEPVKTKKIRGMRRLFLKKGTCSQTYFYLLNREFGYRYEEEERAADTLAGGIYQQGYQCGMLWGVAMAIGAEAYRRTGDLSKATAVAIESTREVMESFTKRTGTIECEEITKVDWGSKASITKYMVTGKALNCFNLAARWAPEAVQSAHEEVNKRDGDGNKPLKCCACEVIRKMGASEQDMAMVAGFAGGLGLSGSGCGALAAVMWYKTLADVKNKTYKYTLSNPVMEKLINDFYQASDYEMECSTITGRKFQNAREHSGFVENGGCKELIEALARA